MNAVAKKRVNSTPGLRPPRPARSGLNSKSEVPGALIAGATS